MEISPGESRDYDEIIKQYQNKKNVVISKIIENDMSPELLKAKLGSEAVDIIFKANMWLNMHMYNHLIKEYDDDTLFFLYKLVSYDYFDAYQAFNLFCGV